MTHTTDTQAQKSLSLLNYSKADLLTFLDYRSPHTKGWFREDDYLSIVEYIVDSGRALEALTYLKAISEPAKSNSLDLSPHDLAGLSNVQSYLAMHGALSTILGDRVVVMMRGDKQASHIKTRAEAVDYLKPRFAVNTL